MTWEGERGGFYFPYHYLISKIKSEETSFRSIPPLHLLCLLVNLMGFPLITCPIYYPVTVGRI